jgi:hypothetical protein
LSNDLECKMPINHLTHAVQYIRVSTRLAGPQVILQLSGFAILPAYRFHVLPIAKHSLEPIESECG